MKILLVEDDEGTAEVLKNALIGQHYLVDLAMDGQTGLSLAEAFAYDLVLLDVMLPKLDGLKFCRQLRAQRARTPVLLLTAQDSSTSKIIGLDAGADDYVVKPFDINELLARIRALIRRGSSTPQGSPSARRSPLLLMQPLSRWLRNIQEMNYSPPKLSRGVSPDKLAVSRF